MRSHIMTTNKSLIMNAIEPSHSNCTQCDYPIGRKLSDHGTCPHNRSIETQSTPATVCVHLLTYTIICLILLCNATDMRVHISTHPVK